MIVTFICIYIQAYLYCWNRLFIPSL